MKRIAAASAVVALLGVTSVASAYKCPPRQGNDKTSYSGGQGCKGTAC